MADPAVVATESRLVGEDSPLSNEGVAQGILDAMAVAWAAGDAVAYAALFTPAAVFVHRSGAIGRGREKIQEGHAWAFKGTHRNSTLEDCRVISATLQQDCAIAVTATRTVVRGVVRNEYDVTMTLARESSGGDWRISRFASKRSGEVEASAQPPFPASESQRSDNSAFFLAASAVGLIALGATLAFLLLGRRRAVSSQ